MSRQLADLLLKDKIISQAQFTEAAEAVSRGEGKSFVRFLIEKKYVAENKLLNYLSQKFGLPSINLAKFEVADSIIKLFSPDLAQRTQAIPIQQNQGTLVVAVADPTNSGKLEAARLTLKMNIESVLTSTSAFDQAMARYYGGIAHTVAAVDLIKKAGKDDDGMAALELVQVHNIDSSATSNDAPVITLVNGILSEAIRRQASDIHVEPYEKRMRVRMRIDGTLFDVIQIPIELKRAVVARFKVMSRMDIAESRVPQDGRIKLRMGGSEIDFRVSTMPTLFGEKIVLRMLSAGSLQLDLMKLGFESQQLEVFKKGIYSPNGMVLVTGPTGSGKTTTLYSSIMELNKVTDNISTVEDPVEYNLDGINQVQTNKDVGLTFANVLRTLLRQDPDIILVGEIRDYETAEVSIQAALTGHLVLSTLHTNDAPGTIARLMNMGVEPFLVVSSINIIIAQRLLRTICSKCKAEQQIPKPKVQEMCTVAGVSDVASVKFYRGTGCGICNRTGYKGRVAIYEILDFSSSLKEMVLKGESIMDIKKQAIKEGMRTLRMSGINKAIQGATTLEEALTMTMEN